MLSLKTSLEQDVVTAGHAVGINRARSYYSNKASYEEKVRGIEFLKFLQDLMENFDEKIENVIEKMEFVYNRMLKRNGVILNITTLKENFEQIEETFISLLNEFPVIEDESYNFTFENENLKEAISTSSDVNYVTFAADMKALKIKYDGKFSLLSKILSTTYMHNNIRAIGGAYGAGFGITRDSEVTMFSYRDPNIKSTKETFLNVGKYVSELEISDEDLEGFKISVVKEFDPLMTPKQKGKFSLSLYISGSDEEELELYLEQLLSATTEEIKSLAGVLNEILLQDNFVVVGNSEKIKENKDEFKKVINLKK